MVAPESAGLRNFLKECEEKKGGKVHRVRLSSLNRQRGLRLGQGNCHQACPRSQQAILIHQNMGHLIHQQFRLVGPIPLLRIYLRYVCNNVRRALSPYPCFGISQNNRYGGKWVFALVQGEKMPQNYARPIFVSSR